MKPIIRFLKMFYNALFNMQAHEDLVLMKFHIDMSFIHDNVCDFKKKYDIPEISAYANHSNGFMKLLIDNKLK